MNMKNLFLAAIALVVFGLLIAAALIWQRTDVQQEKEAMPSRQNPVFSIRQGESVQDIAQNLAEAGYISSADEFLRYATDSGDARRFQAGNYSLPNNFPIPRLSETLTRAVVNQIKVTIPEGFTNTEIDARLSELGLTEPGDFLACVTSCDFSEFSFLPKNPEIRQGYFFPDTYFAVPEQFDSEAFAKQMLTTFDEKTKAVFTTSNMLPSKIVTIASIIEKEAFAPEERPIVSDIFWKRYENGWSLGSDATTRYAVGKMTGKLTDEDFANESLWNTRVHKGLPPGAICNPGLAALQAAAKPAETSYWYFIHDAEKRVYYAETLEEHEANRDKYL